VSVGFLFTLNYDAQNHKLKKKSFNIVYHILEVSHLNFTLKGSEFWSQIKSEVSSQESEWNEKLLVVCINTNCESMLAGIAKLPLFFSYSYMLEYWHLYLSSHTNAGIFCYVGPSTTEWAASSCATQHWCRPLWGKQSSNKKTVLSSTDRKGTLYERVCIFCEWVVF